MMEHNTVRMNKTSEVGEIVSTTKNKKVDGQELPQNAVAFAHILKDKTEKGHSASQNASSVDKKEEKTQKQEDVADLVTSPDQPIDTVVPIQGGALPDSKQATKETKALVESQDSIETSAPLAVAASNPLSQTSEVVVKTSQTPAEGVDNGSVTSNLTDKPLLSPLGSESGQKQPAQMALNKLGTNSTPSSVPGIINNTVGTNTVSTPAVPNGMETVNSNPSMNQQSMGQNGAQTPMQMVFTQLQQAKHLVEQRQSSHFAEELMKAKKTESSASQGDKVASLLGDSGLAFDKRPQLALGLQSINTPVKHPQWGQALGQRVVVMANQKIQEAKIMLNPEKLGPVQIKLHIDKDQLVQVSMHAVHGMTRAAMEDAIPKLKDMLAEAGINFGAVDVGDQASFEQHEAQEDSSHSESGSISQIKIEETDESVTKTTLLELKNDNIVDYYA